MMKIKFKSYIPDILIIVGLAIFAYGIFTPPEEKGGFPSLQLGYTDYHTEEKVFGVVVIAIGVDLFVRRYLIRRKV